MIDTLIIDDERLARAEIKRLLKAHPQINIIGEAANAKIAMDIMQSQPLDLIFLDIQMPGMTGMELAEYISLDTQFVFCTAYDQYAVDAFALNATDYLVKPIEPARLAACIGKIEDNQAKANASQEADNSGYLPENHGVLMKFGEINRVVRLHEIERLESIGNHTAVYSKHGKAFVHSSLSKVESKLDPQFFFKANRGDIIRIDYIDRIEPGIKTGSSIAFLRSGEEIEISRRQVQQLKQLFSGF